MRRAGRALIAVVVGSGLGACGTAEDAGSGASNLAIETAHCEVYGSGAQTDSTLGGEVRDEGGVPGGTWAHTDGVGALVGDPDTLVCRINGSRVADVRGTGTWNGVPGHTFRLHVQDRGDGTSTSTPGPFETRTLLASRTYSPSRTEDGHLAMDAGFAVLVPASMPVVEGNAGDQWTTLTFDLPDGEQVRCHYQGGASCTNPHSPADIEAGRTVTLDRCERFVAAEEAVEEDHGHGGRPGRWWRRHRGHRGHHHHHHFWHKHHRDCGEDGEGSWVTDPALVAGAELDAVGITLHVDGGSSRFPDRRRPVTRVEASLDVAPNVEIPGIFDYVRLNVWAPDGELVHIADGDLVSGDLVVSLLP